MSEITRILKQMGRPTRGSSIKEFKAEQLNYTNAWKIIHSLREGERLTDDDMTAIKEAGKLPFTFGNKSPAKGYGELVLAMIEATPEHLRSELENALKEVNSVNAGAGLLTR